MERKRGERAEAMQMAEAQFMYTFVKCALHLPLKSLCPIYFIHDLVRGYLSE
jgi:hypothetical protein